MFEACPGIGGAGAGTGAGACVIAGACACACAGGFAPGKSGTPVSGKTAAARTASFPTGNKSIMGFEFSFVGTRLPKAY